MNMKKQEPNQAGSTESIIYLKYFLNQSNKKLKSNKINIKLIKIEKKC